MLQLIYLLKGILIGFIVSAPTGPVGAICLKRTLNRGKFHGYAAGLGATAADGFYALLAAFGLSFVICFLEDYNNWFRLLGGVFLILMGVYLLRDKSKNQEVDLTKPESGHLGQSFSAAFLLNLSNFLMLLVYLAIFSGFGVDDPQVHLFSAISIVLGVMMGCALWWFLFVTVAALFRSRMTPHSLVTMNKITSWIVIGFGILVLLTIVLHIKIFGQRL